MEGPPHFAFDFAVACSSNLNTTKNRVIPTGAEGEVEGPPYFVRSCNTLSMPEQAYVYIVASSFQPTAKTSIGPI